MLNLWPKVSRIDTASRNNVCCADRGSEEEGTSRKNDVVIRWHVGRIRIECKRDGEKVQRTKKLLGFLSLPRVACAHLVTIHRFAGFATIAGLFSPSSTKTSSKPRGGSNGT